MAAGLTIAYVTNDASPRSSPPAKTKPMRSRSSQKPPQTNSASTLVKITDSIAS